METCRHCKKDNGEGKRCKANHYPDAKDRGKLKGDVKYKSEKATWHEYSLERYSKGCDEFVRDKKKKLEAVKDVE